MPIKCPSGSFAAKEYHKFKSFYAIVLMAILDASYRFVWESCGFPEDSNFINSSVRVLMKCK